MTSFLNAIINKLSEQSLQDMPPSSESPTVALDQSESFVQSIGAVLTGNSGDDDSWSDTTSTQDDNRDLDGAIDTDEADGKGYGQDMPSLFGKDLPPCGPEIQLAYENVNKRLRKQWLADLGATSALDVCLAVRCELEHDEKNRPPFSRPSATTRVLGRYRTPWRRESVFLYELRWIDYFVREANEAREANHAEPMTESGILARAGPPSELHLPLERQDILQLWDAWHAKKRGTSPILQDRPDTRLGYGLSNASTAVDAGTQVD